MKLPPLVFALFLLTCQLLLAQDDNLAGIERKDLMLMAQTAYRAKDFGKAEVLGGELLRRDKEEYGLQSEVTWGSMVWLRCSLEKLQKFDRAIDLQNKLLAAKRKVSGDAHWSLKSDELILQELGVLKRMSDEQWQQVLKTRQLMSACHIAISNGQPKKGMLVGKHAVAQLQKLFGEDCWQVISVYNNLSIAADRTGQLNDGMAFAQRSLQVQLIHYGANHPETALRLNTLGAIQVETGRHQVAERSYKDALSILRETRGAVHRDIGLVLNNLGDLHRLMSLPEEAAGELREAIQIREKSLGKQHADTIVSRSNLALVLVETGELRQATTILEGVLQYRLKRYGKMHLDTASSFNNKGTCLYRLGRFPEAITCVEQALTIYRRLLGNGHRQTIGVQSNLGVIWLDAGDTAKAFELQSSASEAAEDSEDQRLQIVCQNNLAGVYRDIGDYQAAIICFSKASELSTQLLGKESEPHLLTAYNLADIRRRMGKPGEAATALKDCHQKYVELLGEKHPKTLVAASGYANALLDNGRFEIANEIYQEVFTIREEKLGQHHPATGIARNGIAATLGAMGQTQEARILLETDLKQTYALRGKSHPEALVTLQNLAALSKREGNYAAAAKLLVQANRTGERNVALHRNLSDRQAMQMRLIQRRSLHDWCSVTIQGQLPCHNLYEAIMRWNAFGFERRLASGNQADTKTREELGEINQRVAALLNRPEGVSDRIGEFQKLTDRKEKLEGILLSKINSLDRLTLKKTLDQLDGQALVLHFFEYVQTEATSKTKFEGDRFRVVAGGGIAERRMALFALSKSSGLRVVDLGRVSELDTLVSTWKQSFGSGIQAKAAASSLSKLIWKPVANLSKDAERIIVVPDGVLAGFPMSALPLAEGDDQLLLDRFVVCRSTGPASFKTPKLEEPGVLLLVGDVDYDVEDSKSLARFASRKISLTPAPKAANFEALSGTAKEIDETAQAFKQALPKQSVITLVGKDASKANVIEALPKSRYAVLATHGFFKNSLENSSGLRSVAVGYHPDVQSGIALAGANSNSNGLLTALELRGLDLARMEVAVLSTCFSGAGVSVPSEGLLGLNRNVLAGGCQYTISSLSEIDDNATQLLMREFWSNHLEKKQDVASALRNAQLKIRREYDSTTRQFRNSLGVHDNLEPNTSKTKLWAPFVVTKRGF